MLLSVCIIKVTTKLLYNKNFQPKQQTESNIYNLSLQENQINVIL
jgi:hypothetical protein